MTKKADREYLTYQFPDSGISVMTGNEIDDCYSKNGDFEIGLVKLDSEGFAYVGKVFKTRDELEIFMWGPE